MTRCLRYVASVAIGLAAMPFLLWTGAVDHDTDLPAYRRFSVHDPFGNRLEILRHADL